MAHTQHWQNKEPRYFTKNGHADMNPNQVKKDGFGKGNWGKPGDEIDDLINSGEIDAGIWKGRRGSNSNKNEERMNV
ncbi:Tma10 protein [Martiniozyma asiatica (nom. inval.)]|nr:Tma10 protein [Martiniozyma asiatica]